MAVDRIIKYYPLERIVDVFISYFRYLFSNVNIIGNGDWMWNIDERKSNIRITSGYPDEFQKSNWEKYILVNRLDHNIDNTVIKNMVGTDRINHGDIKYTNLYNGYLNVVTGCRSPSEASCIANFLAQSLDVDKYGIMQTSKFIRNIKCVSFSGEMPVRLSTQIEVSEVSLNVFDSIQVFYDYEMEKVICNHINVKCIDENEIVESDTGEVVIDSKDLVDNQNTFGTTTDEPPSDANIIFDSYDLGKGFYYIIINDYYYYIKSVVDEHTLNMYYYLNGVQTDLVFEETKATVNYKIYRNGCRIEINV